MTNFEHLWPMVSSWIWGRATMSNSFAPPGGGSAIPAPPSLPPAAGTAGATGPSSVRLDAPPLAGAAPVVRDRGDVLDPQDLEPGRGEGPDRGLPAGAGTLHEHVDLRQAMLLRTPGRRLGGQLGGEGRRLPGSLEPHVAGAGPRQRVAVEVGDGDDRVVERRLDVGLTVGDVLLLPSPRLLRLRLGHCALPYFPFLRRTPTVFLGPLRVRALVCVRWPRTGRLRRCRTPWYELISILRLMSWATSRRRSPSTL